MKTIYIATARGVNDDDIIQENAYTSAELALKRAKAMCDDIMAHQDRQLFADAEPMYLYEDGDDLDGPTLSSE